MMYRKSLLCLWLLTSQLLPAQVTTGSLQGMIRDSSGSVIPAVTLELFNTSTNSKNDTQSNNAGIYIFNLVPPGTYQLRASFTGFKTADIQGVIVEIGRNTVIDINLQPGDVTQRVEVTAAVENVDTQSSVVKANISSRTFSNLPLASRNPLRFAEMAPGVDMQFGMTGGSQMLGADGASANVSGGRRQQNTFYLDGADNSNVRRNASLQMPNVDAIAELQVVTNSNSAEYGKQPGGYFNVITKSGTNEFHGSAFYFFRDENLNANTWVRNSSGLARGPNREKMAGGTLGGPVKRDKTFFFGSFQHYRDQNLVTSATTRYPTARMLAGDLSEYGAVLYNPDTGAPIPGNNLAAAGLIDPAAANLAKIIPSVARLGDRLVFDYDLSPRNNEFLGKLDHNFGSSQRVQFSYFGTRGSTPVVSGGTRAMPGLTRGSNAAAQNTMSLRHTWTLSAQTILESQASVARYRLETQPGPNAVGRDLSDFGVRWPQPIPVGKKMLPDLEVLDGFNSPQLSTGFTDEGNLRLMSTVTRISGKHNLKFGGDVQRVGFQRFVDSDNSQFRFQGLFSNRGSGAFPAIPNAQFVHSFADFMMGRVNDFTANGKMDYSLPTWGFFGFVQDQWRITRRITLNFGARYEIWKAMTEINGRASAFVEGHKSKQFPNAPLHLAFQGDQGIPGGFIRQDRNNLAPRLGLSWDVLGDGKLALRAGYGTYYAFPAAQMRLFATEEFPQRPVIQGFTARLRDPWATSASPRFSSPPTPYPKDTLEWIRAANFNPPYARIIGYHAGFSTPLSHQWNATLERQVTGGMTVSAAYVANRGRHLMRGFPFNYARFRNLPDGTPPSLDPRNILARQPFPDYSRFSIRMDSDSVADYDSLQTWANLRAGKLVARVLYTYARHSGDGGGLFSTPDEDIEGFTTTVDNPANPKGEYGQASRRHTFRAFWSYDLPLWRNAGWAGRMLGGWQLSGSLYVHSGNPQNIILGYDANFDAITSRPQDRPDLAGPIRYTSGSAEQKMRQYFDPSVFVRPVITAEKTTGNLPRNALFNPGRWGSDLAVLKNFRLSENHNFQLRAEAYHWLNNPLLDGAGNNMSAGDFARILTKSGNRTMQIGLRYSF